MKILMAHTAYQQRGGEDAVFDSEAALLEQNGYEVRRLLVRNDHIVGITAKIKAALSIVCNKGSVGQMKAALDAFQPDIVHIHNFFPTLSPAVIAVAARRGVPVVVTLHNYRPLCAAATLMRNNKPCEACVGKSRWRGVLYRCYRNSVIGSACVGFIGGYLKKIIRKYPNKITFIALTEFAKSRYVADGFPAQNIVVRGNGMGDVGAGAPQRENKLIYVGRLSAEKGVETLIQAARDIDGIVEIIGDGPDRQMLETKAEGRVVFSGALPPDKVLDKIKTARAVVMPSRWYEGFPMVVLEAMASATPVIASRIGSLAEIIQDGETGFLVDPFDPDAWKQKLSVVMNDAEGAARVGQQARQHFLTHCTNAAMLGKLLVIYREATGRAKTA